ncbi:SdiA-regulated domain-containing protein [Seohaeicola saemankumensis]|nr:SdiA-regulated domain-containing protein [Seohaeicola saemankumensis]MCA0873704.1 SdiA-regulated domain-containing protein [Seohaeicola saemankumensis]
MNRPAERGLSEIFGHGVAVGALSILVQGAVASDAAAEITLSFVEARRIADPSAGFVEVSGLSLALGDGFWSVSDDTARVFRLDAKGDVHRKRSLPGETDLEGVAEDVNGHRVLAVREDTSEILSVSHDGTISRFALLSMEGAQALAPYFISGDNNGLEGIAVNPETGAVYVLKERHPRLLIELAPDLTRVLGALHLTPDIGFVSSAAGEDQLDVSGLAWDTRRKGFWICSDTGEAVFFLDTSTMTARGWTLMDARKKKLEPVRNAEGVALSADGITLYVVTDDGKKSRLLTYRIDGNE